jgi:hypothetical protein
VKRPRIVNKKLLSTIQKYIKKHHSLYSTPVRSEQWDEILFKSLKENGYDVNWDPYTHKIGEDVFCAGYGRISCKGGVINNHTVHGEYLSFNGSRTTSYKTLNEKIEFMKNKKEDVYFCLAKYKADKKNITEYQLIVFDTKLIDYKKLKWNKHKKDFRGQSKGLYVEIRNALSDQIWIHIHMYKLKNIYTIPVA